METIMKQLIKSRLPRLVVLQTLTLVFLVASYTVYAGEPATKPIFLMKRVQPIMMLNMSRDHQLFFKLYDDYSDIDIVQRPETVDKPYTTAEKATIGPDTTYKSSIDYFGYFDSNRCYTYASGVFSPSATASKTCSNAWSGNFLNWATMTRIDAIRKILYGGYRSTDTATATVLERAYIPPDTHAFAKFYDGADLGQLVPTAVYNAGGITMCNVSDTTTKNANSTGFSQNDGSPPLMKVAKGNYALWANNERWQCKWLGQKPTSTQFPGNSNNTAISGLDSISTNPAKPDPASNSEFIVRIESCVKDKVGADEDCKLYSDNATTPKTVFKPIGLLQKWGESDQIKFGLVTGSYAKSKSGGVLRKNAGSIKDEINPTTGQILVPAADATTNTIITTINKFKIFGYDLTNGLYSLESSTGDWYGPPNVTPGTIDSDDCNWFGGANGHSNAPVRRAKFDNGRCSNWGNPQAEIYLESLRYLAGQTNPSDAYKVTDVVGVVDASDTDRLPGLLTATWVDPINEGNEGNYCAPLNVLQFNASVISYDADDLIRKSGETYGGVRDIGLADQTAIDAIMNLIAGSDAEGITGKSYFMGEDGVATSSNKDIFQVCTAKTVTDFAKVRGICSEAPRLEGSYFLAALAYHAHSTGVKAKREKVKTFGVAMAPAVPSITVRTGIDDKTLTIMPACRNKSSYSYAAGKTVAPDLESNCAIVDFKIVSQTATDGKLYVSWEDSEQGGDFDQDMWGIIEYSINKVAKTVTVSTRVAAQSTGDQMGFGYVIGGTTNDGFKVHSGINDYEHPGSHCTGPNTCTCNTGNTTGACQADQTVEPNGIADKIPKTYTLLDSSTPASSAEKLKDPLYYAAKWGGYAKTAGDIPTADELKAIAASKPDNYFYATDPRALKESLNSAFSGAVRSSGTAATVAANSTQLNEKTYIYQARFSSSDWSGQVLARKLNTTGIVDKDADALWTTDTTLTRTSTRKIYTYDGDATSRATVQLTTANWAASLPSLKSALRVSPENDDVSATKRFNWILGADTDETGKANGILRARTNLLGDVVNSDPAYAGLANMKYDRLPQATTAEKASYGAITYAQHVKDKSDRKSALFVGSNDGMLHAFDVTNGAELFAYIPRGVYAKLAEVSKPSYDHQFLVDGPVFVGDAYITVGGVKKWRTVVTGTLGAGGKGAYALDVTDTLKDGTDPRVIFDVTNDKDNIAACKLGGLANCDDLGYATSRVVVVPVANGTWQAIFGNGTHSTSGVSKLISINLDNPASVSVIDTQAKCATASSYPCTALLDNGLAEPALLPNANGIVTHAYAGDILGNLWKFQLSDNSIPFQSVGIPKPLINLIDAGGNPQPITSPPTLGYNSLKKVLSGADSVMVYVGTGKYSEVGDITSTYVQSMYAIADADNAITLTTTNREEKLHKKLIATSSSASVRTITGDKTPESTKVPAVDWTSADAKDGWFLDLVQGTDKKGERVISKPLLMFDRLIFPTFIPSNNPCDYGGKSWLMELTGVGDKFIGHDILGNKANRTLDSAMVSSITAISAGEKIVFIGTGLDRGPNNVKDDIFTKEGSSVPGIRGRMSWRQTK
jgi:type IV pilus assembly protein PilY1